MRGDYLVDVRGPACSTVSTRALSKDEAVEVVIRPEDLDVVPVTEGKLRGRVKSVLFKGVHYDTMVETRAGHLDHGHR